jgi:D-glycero-D-manno-heptose 1,7-bisphosphate phosphatase
MGGGTLLAEHNAVRPAIFFDRDGVLTPDVGYPRRLEDAILYEDVIPALRDIQKAGYLILVVSNQSGVSRGLFTLADVERFNRRLAKSLHRAGIALTSQHFYICPHGPNDLCDCRKPKPGLFFKAAKEYDVDLKRSFCVGDKKSDIEAGRNAGLFTVLLNRSANSGDNTADLVVHDLRAVADFLRSNTSQLNLDERSSPSLIR